MKVFGTWLLGTLIAFAVLGGAYHVWLDGNPRKIVVVVDSSYAMNDVWHRVQRKLKEFDDDRRYTEFALLTEKGRAHGWKTRLTPTQLTPYGPRSFAKLLDGQSFPELSEADEVYVVTNAPSSEAAALDAWEIIKP